MRLDGVIRGGVVAAMLGLSTIAASSAVAAPVADVQPRTIAPGVELTVTGSGWPAGQAVSVVASSVPLCDPIDWPTADDAGVIDGTCVAKRGIAGHQTIYARSAPPSPPVTVPVGHGLILPGFPTPLFEDASPGRPIAIEAGGFAASAPMTATLTGRPMLLAPFSATDALGTLRSTATVPSTFGAGAYRLTLADNAFHVLRAPVRVWTPTFRLSPTNGRAGTVVHLTGSGWPPSRSVDLRFGSLGDAGWSCLVQTDDDGNLDFNICSVGDDVAGGRTRVEVQLATYPAGTASVGVAKTDFVVRPAMTVTGYPARAGDGLIIEGTGFVAGQTVQVNFDDGPMPVGGEPVVNSRGQLYVVPTIPAGVGPGYHTISVVDTVANKTLTKEIRVLPPADS